MDGRYGALKVVAAIVKGLGYLVAAVGVIVLVVGLLGLTSEPADITGLLIPSGYAIGIGVVWAALGELVHVFIAIEANTRASRELLERLLAARRSGEAET